MLQGARESVFTTKADHSFFTEPVSCLVFNAVGKTNVSILVDVHCESPGAHLTPRPAYLPPRSGVRGMNRTFVSVSASPVGPILLVEPQPKTVDVDSDVTLNCKWAGNPPLTLTWFKKGSNMVRAFYVHLFFFPSLDSSSYYSRSPACLRTKMPFFFFFSSHSS